MAPLETIEEYHDMTRYFESCLERFGHFVMANAVQADKKLAAFLTVTGAQAYEVLKSFVVSAVPGDNLFEEVELLLRTHCSPRG